MPSLKQIGTICFVFSLILISQKSYSDIAANNSNPSCDNSTLNTYTGPAALEAKWNANTIQLKWYKDDELLTVQTAANQCTYDGTMTLPSTRPSKIGYDFNGWKVKTGGSSSNSCFVGPVCGLTSSLAGSDGTDYGYRNDSRGEYGVDSRKTTEYGLTSDQTWAVEFSHGIVKGTASCNNTRPTIWDTVMAGMMNETMTEEQQITALWGSCSDTIQPTGTFDTSNAGTNCWCHAESYTPNAGNSCSVSSLAWVFSNDYGAAPDCALLCAANCAHAARNNAAFRAAVFGVANN